MKDGDKLTARGIVETVSCCNFALKFKHLMQYVTGLLQNQANSTVQI